MKQKNKIQKKMPKNCKHEKYVNEDKTNTTDQNMHIGLPTSSSHSFGYKIKDILQTICSFWKYKNAKDLLQRACNMANTTFFKKN